MRNSVLTISAGIALAGLSPATARTGNFADSLRAFKSTLGQLPGKRSPSVPSGGAAPAVSAAASAFDSTEALLADEPDSTRATAVVRPRDASTFDVGGFRLGMSPREAIRVARARGITPTMILNAGTWEAQARQKANLSLSDDLKVRGRTLETLNGAAGDGSTSQVGFIPTPQGTQIGSLYYVTPSQGQTPEAILTTMIARYGQPTKRMPFYNGITAVWCGADRECANETLSSVDHLTAEISRTEIRMSLRLSGQYRRTMRDALDAYGRKLAAQNARPVAF